MRKASQREPQPPALLFFLHGRWSSVFCTSHRLCHGLQRVSKQPVVTAMKGDFGELQAKGYQTSPPDTSIISVLDQCGLSPLYLTQTQLGDGTFFTLTHLGDKLGITGGPPAHTSGSFLSDPAGAFSACALVLSSPAPPSLPADHGGQ